MTGLVSVGFLHPGHWSACFGSSLLDLMFYDAAHDGRIVRSGQWANIPKETGAAQIHAGRNKLMSTFLDDSPAEWLFMVDSDMGFAPDIVDRLVGSADPVERPVVGALAFANKSNGAGPMFARRYRACPTLYSMRETETEIGFLPMFDYPRDELVSVDATGAAAVLIHRTVGEKIRAEHGDRWFTPVELPKGPTEFGEDMSFCLRVAASGFPMFVDTAAKTTHDKFGVFLDEETYDLQRAFLAAA